MQDLEKVLFTSDQIQARVDTFVDDIAERAVSLGGAAHGTSAGRLAPRAQRYRRLP